MHQVVGDVDSGERSLDRSRVGCVRRDPLRTVGVCGRPAGHADDVVGFGEERDERPPDRPGRTDHGDAHSVRLPRHARQETPADQVVHPRLEPPQWTAEQGSESFDADQRPLPDRPAS